MTCLSRCVAYHDVVVVVVGRRSSVVGRVLCIVCCVLCVVYCVLCIVYCVCHVVVVVMWLNFQELTLPKKSLIFVGKMCVFFSRPMKLATSPRENGEKTHS